MSGFVYLIGTRLFGWYKIGKSKSPDVRVRDLGILLPFKIHVLAVWKAEDHDLLEKTLHELYASNRINGEWFEFKKHEVNELIDKKIMKTARVFPSEEEFRRMSSFSNIQADTKEQRRVLGLRVEKLRGDFTPEEREQRRIQSMEEKRLKRLKK